MLVRRFLVFTVAINIPCKDGEDVEDMEVSGSEASEGLCPESTSNSDCGECCGGHAPHPTLSMSPRSPNIIPGRDGCTRTPFPEVPCNFLLPDSLRNIVYNSLNSPRSLPLLLDVPEKAFFLIV